MKIRHPEKQNKPINPIKIAVDSVKKIISTSVDKNKLDAIFEKDLEEAKTELKKINS